MISQTTDHIFTTPEVSADIRWFKAQEKCKVAKVQVSQKFSPDSSSCCPDCKSQLDM